MGVFGKTFASNDRQLAAFCYGKMDIPTHDWESHYRLDCWHGSLTQKARTAYQHIFNSHLGVK